LKDYIEKKLKKMIEILCLDQKLTVTTIFIGSDVRYHIRDNVDPRMALTVDKM